MEAAKYFEDHKMLPGRSGRERRDERDRGARYRASNAYRGANAYRGDNRAPSRVPDNRDDRPADNRDNRDRRVAFPCIRGYLLVDTNSTMVSELTVTFRGPVKGVVYG